MGNFPYHSQFGNNPDAKIFISRKKETTKEKCIHYKKNNVFGQYGLNVDAPRFEMRSEELVKNTNSTEADVKRRSKKKFQRDRRHQKRVAYFKKRKALKKLEKMKKWNLNNQEIAKIERELHIFNA